MFYILHLLAVLNVVDAVFTFIGLKDMLIVELNPIMKWVWDFSPYSFLALKIGLSVLVTCITKYTHLLGKADWLRGILIFACSFYFGVFIIHLRWIFG
jgi:hypothetical protein